MPRVSEWPYKEREQLIDMVQKNPVPTYGILLELVSLHLADAGKIGEIATGLQSRQEFYEM